MRPGWRIILFYLLSIVVGAFTGLVGTLFRLSINFLSHIKLDFTNIVAHFGLPPWGGAMLFSGTCVLIAMSLVYAFSPEASGSGVQEIEGVLLGKRKINWRALLPVKFCAGVLSIASGMVVGREGPTIQMGGNIGEMFGERFKLTREKRDILIGAGAASGLACAFNAPLAGIVFILEEMREHFKFSFLSFKSVAIACVFSTIVLRAIIGQGPAIEMTFFHHPSLTSLVLFFVLGLIVGIVGLFFNVILMTMIDTLGFLQRRQRFIYALVVGILVGLVGYLYPGLVGGGYDIISQALNMKLATYMLVLLAIGRFISTIVCYSTGVPGGIFAPMLGLGTLIGIAYGNICELFAYTDVHSGMFAVAAMGALFSACIRAPVTGIILIVEMTQNYQLILPSMVACLTATTIVQIANNPPIYEQLLNRTLKNQLDE